MIKTSKLTALQEVHLQAVINANNAAALGVSAQQSYIPTPDAVRATDVKFDELYPKVFTEPSTYIRFSSTVEDCTGVAYCMNEDDASFLAQLNEGKDLNGQPLKDKTRQCSEDTFEEIMNFFEEVSKREQPYAILGSAPILTLNQMQESADGEEPLSSDAQWFMSPVYEYWASRKGDRPMMPTIKVRVLDTTSDADEADPYVCFRRREVRQTRKTRGRDAQIQEKLKKLRLELELARGLVESVRAREEKNKANLEVTRKVFDLRHALKEVKVSKQIIGDKGEDEELLVNQKVCLPEPAHEPQPADHFQPIVKTNRSGGQQRPTLRLSRSINNGNAAENDLVSLNDQRAEEQALVAHTIDSRKDQHRRWNQHWQDLTWNPLTPPPDDTDQPLKWAPLISDKSGLPTPPPSLPSRSSHDRDGDLEMTDSQPPEQDTQAGAEAGPEYRFSFSVPPPYPMDTYFGDDNTFAKRSGTPSCRLRYGRGGRVHLEARRHRARGAISRGVVSDSESDDDIEDYYSVSEAKAFDYRCALNVRPRPDGGRPSDAVMTAANAATAATAALANQVQQQQAVSGSNS